MPESPDDKQVDSAIVKMQALLDELKSAQEKDVKDEDAESGEEKPFGGKNLKEAEQEAYVRVRSHRRRRRQADDEPSSEK